MKIMKCEQGSVEWMLARCGVPTASEFDQLVTPKFEVRKGEMPKTYLARKLAEKWLGGPLPGFGSIDMEFGQILEQEAIPWLELEHGVTVQRVGFITTDDGRIGCSPDGLIGEDCGLEVKCPNPHTHVKYLLNGKVPDEYITQVFGGMLVTRFKKWRFLSYCRNFPALDITVEWDVESGAALFEAIDAFNRTLADAWNRLCEINGGEPKRPEFKPQPQPERVYQLQDDIIP